MANGWEGLSVSEVVWCDNDCNGMKFTTRDNDNDIWYQNCAKDLVGYLGGFW